MAGSTFVGSARYRHQRRRSARHSKFKELSVRDSLSMIRRGLGLKRCSSVGGPIGRITDPRSFGISPTSAWNLISSPTRNSARRSRGTQSTTWSAKTNWLHQHASRYRIPLDDLALAFLDALISYRGIMINSAADEPMVQGVEMALAEVLKAHELIGICVLNGLPGLASTVFIRPWVFRRLVVQALDWIHFTKDGHDRVRRGGQRAVI